MCMPKRHVVRGGVFRRLLSILLLLLLTYCLPMHGHRAYSPFAFDRSLIVDCYCCVYAYMCIHETFDCYINLLKMLGFSSFPHRLLVLCCIVVVVVVWHLCRNCARNARAAFVCTLHIIHLLV